MRYIKALTLALIITLTGCASGVKHKDMAESMPTLEAEKGRIYFYRSSSIVGAAIQPSIMLDGVEVGRSKPGGFFYVDSKAGDHEVMCTTEVEKKLTFTLGKGEVKYVRTSTSFGVLAGRIIPELVGPEDAQKELPEMSFTGVMASK